MASINTLKERTQALRGKTIEEIRAELTPRPKRKEKKKAKKKRRKKKRQTGGRAHAEAAKLDTEFKRLVDRDEGEVE